LNSNNEKQSGLLTSYTNRKNRFESQGKKQKQKLNRVALMRLLVFVMVVVFIYQSLKSNTTLWLAMALLSFIVLLRLVKMSAGINRVKNHLKALTDLNRNELFALDGDFKAFEDGREFINREHPYMYDLDLFGDQSVFQFMNRSFTERGKKELASYLVDPLQDGKSIMERQLAVKDISKRLDWRQHFQATAMNLKQNPADEERLLEWLSNKSTGIVPEVFRILAFTLPLISFLLILLSLPGWINWQIPMYFMLIPLTVVGGFLQRTQKFSLKMASALKTLKNHGDLIRQIENESFQASLLQKVQKTLFDQSGSASESIKVLGKILDAFDSRNNIFVGVILNALLLWDIHCLLRFEKWKSKNGKQARIWFETIGQMDALSSLGTLLYNHPGYSFPLISDKPFWEFVSVGHPLIPAGSRIDNDLNIENEGKIFIVTGPNMAGKSTFLRTLGVNLVFAMAGAPVCAEKMVFFPNRLFTSMRTTDSLQKNESYFYSELKRLRVLLNTVEQRSVFFLLDEILKGTNSADKSSGSVAIIQKLIRLHGTGLIATHDLSLGELEKSFPGKVINKCFEAEIKNNELHFDFKLHDGITGNMNATFLMKKLGIIG